MYLCLVSVPLTYSEVYGFNTGQSGLVYITQTIGSFIGFGIEVYCNRLYRRHEAEKGTEARLFTACECLVHRFIVGFPSELTFFSHKNKSLWRSSLSDRMLDLRILVVPSSTLDRPVDWPHLSL